MRKESKREKAMTAAFMTIANELKNVAGDYAHLLLSHQQMWEELCALTNRDDWATTIAMRLELFEILQRAHARGAVARIPKPKPGIV